MERWAAAMLLALAADCLLLMVAVVVVAAARPTPVPRDRGRPAATPSAAAAAAARTRELISSAPSCRCVAFMTSPCRTCANSSLAAAAGARDDASSCAWFCASLFSVVCRCT